MPVPDAILVKQIATLITEDADLYNMTTETICLRLRGRGWLPESDHYRLVWEALTTSRLTDRVTPRFIEDGSTGVWRLNLASPSMLVLQARILLVLPKVAPYTLTYSEIYVALEKQGWLPETVEPHHQVLHALMSAVAEDGKTPIFVGAGSRWGLNGTPLHFFDMECRKTALERVTEGFLEEEG